MEAIESVYKKSLLDLTRTRDLSKAIAMAGKLEGMEIIIRVLIGSKTADALIEIWQSEIKKENCR